MIPVSPAAHYLCGGIAVDLNGKTNIKGLFSIGEASRTGLHGANRLASNSLMEAIVFAKNLAVYLNNKFSLDLSKISEESKELSKRYQDINYEPSMFKYDKVKLQKIMWEKVGILRNKKDLKQALGDLEKLREDAGVYAKSVLDTAIRVTKVALVSKPIGTHFLQNIEKNLKTKEL